VELCEGNQTIDFYLRTIWDNGQEYNPFGYGFSRDWTTNGTNSWRKGARFYFLAYEGWVSQFFNTFDAQKPDPIVFQIPDECNNAPYCYFLQEPPNTTTTSPTTITTITTTNTTTITTTSNAAFNLKTTIIPFAILFILFAILA